MLWVLEQDVHARLTPSGRLTPPHPIRSPYKIWDGGVLLRQV